MIISNEKYYVIFAALPRNEMLCNIWLPPKPRVLFNMRMASEQKYYISSSTYNPEKKIICWKTKTVKRVIMISIFCLRKSEPGNI